MAVPLFSEAELTKSVGTAAHQLACFCADPSKVSARVDPIN
jgi:hypothetical protein